MRYAAAVVFGLVTWATAATTHAETAFVAGGSGRTGIEVVRALQAAGLDVRASTRNAQRAAARHPDVKTWVQVNAHDPARLNEAVKGSDIVISTLGHADFVGPEAPQFVGYLAVRNIIEAAMAANAKHVILITSSTAGHARGVDHRQEARFGYVLYWKTKAEDFLIESGLPYTIVGPGGLADEFLVRLRAIQPPPEEGWGVKIMPRPAYSRDFIDRKGVADVVLRAIRNPNARGKAVAAVWDKTLPAGEMSGSFAQVPVEATGKSYSSPQ
jgi:nucleoside-diphosphate-sugar epimerase